MSKSMAWLWAGVLMSAACSTVNHETNGAPSPALPQDGVGQRDYSPSGLFAERHGSFLTKAKRYEPRLMARYSLMPNGQLTSEPGSFDLQEVRVRGDAPIVLDPGNYLTLGGEFRTRQYNVSRNVLGAFDEDVYVLGLRLGAGVFVNEDFLLEGMFRPGIYSDLDGTLTSDDWQWFGHAMGTFRVRDDVFLKAGLAVSEDFADVGLIPLAGVSWLIGDQWRVDILLPHRAEVSWSPNSGATTIALGGYLEGDQYFVRGPATGGKRRAKWQTQEITVAATLIHRLNDYISVFGSAGSAIAGDYKFRDGTSQRFDGSLEPTAFFNVGVGFDF